MMRVLHVNAGNLYGGIETLLLTLARQRELCAGVEPHFALFFEGRQSEELREAGVPVYLLGGVRVSRPWTVWLARRKMRRLLAEQRFDVVVTHGCWNHALAAPVARRAGLPVVFWGHAIQSGKHWLERWARWSPPDLVLANSLVTRESVAATLFPRSRSEVLYLPVTPPQLGDRAAVRGEVRQEIGTPASAVVVVTVSRLEGGKGHPVLIDALGRLADVPGWESWIVGGAQRPAEEKYVAGLHELAERRGVSRRVRFLGQRRDVPRLLAAADVHCQPNTGPDSFGLAFIEALYAGLPVVTSGIGGAAEIIDDGCGLLVPPGDVERLAEALSRLLTDAGLRQRLSAAGRPRAEALCDPARQLGRLGSVLRELRIG